MITVTTMLFFEQQVHILAQFFQTKPSNSSLPKIFSALVSTAATIKKNLKTQLNAVPNNNAPYF